MIPQKEAAFFQFMFFFELGYIPDTFTGSIVSEWDQVPITIFTYITMYQQIIWSKLNWYLQHDFFVGIFPQKVRLNRGIESKMSKLPNLHKTNGFFFTYSCKTIQNPPWKGRLVNIPVPTWSMWEWWAWISHCGDGHIPYTLILSGSFIAANGVEAVFSTEVQNVSDRFEWRRLVE